jgi:FKBP-type peptidyl-prolyl cis-trans isomerase (trigger factor)
MKKTVTKLPKSEIAISVSIPSDMFATFRTRALEAIAEHVEIAGFRKGKAPHHLVEKELKPMALLEEMANQAITEHLPTIFIEEKIDAIGRPMIQINKLAEGNDFEFTATVATVPEVKLPDYKKIAASTKGESADTSVSDAELDEAIKELKRARKHQEMHDAGTPHNEEDVAKEEMDATLTDEYVQGLGDFATVDDFKTKFRENIQKEKESREREKRRVAILEGIIAKTEVDMPELLIESEAEQLLARMQHDVTRMGLSFEDYLKHIQKTEADIRADLRPDAEKRAKSELILFTIGSKESIKPEPETIEKESAALMAMYKDADPTRVRTYVTQMLTSEAILKFLEEQK